MTPYHPQCNGLVERFHETLIDMLIHLVNGKPEDWDKYLSENLFAYRKNPQATLGYATLELLYGCAVLLSALRHPWTREGIPEELRSAHQCVTDLHEKPGLRGTPTKLGLRGTLLTPTLSELALTKHDSTTNIHETAS